MPHQHQILGRAGLLLMALVVVLRGQVPFDWPKEIGKFVAARHYDLAMSTSEDWIRAYPNDLDARAWHARICRWQGHTDQAIREYRALLGKVPRDADLLLELSRMLASRKEYRGALELLEQAISAAPERTDCVLEKARTLARAGRRSEAKGLYQRLAAVEVGKTESNVALMELREGSRYQLIVGANSDLISYAPNGSALSAVVDARWNARWSTSAGVIRYGRFGKTAEGVEASASYRPSAADAIVFGGSAAGNAGIAPRTLWKLGYSHGLRFGEGRIVRGLELSYDQKWVRYPDARIVNFAPSVSFYLPRNWIWTGGISTARTVMESGSPSWSRSAQTRLMFPLHAGYTGQLLLASGAENFGTLDQVLFRNSKLAAAGLKVRIVPGQEINALIGYQQIAGGRTQVSLRLVYALRF